MQYLGDFSEDSSVYIPFNTFDSNDPQASVTATTLIASDIYVHKDGSVTDIVTDGATIAIDFDGVTGNHLITIDTSAHADYSIGSDYLVRIEGATVDGGNINAIVGSFSIENRFNEVDVTKWLGTAVATPTTAGVPSVALTAIGLDAIGQAATGMVEIAKAVWDRVLTGATHNISNSAGKRVRQIDAAFEVHSGTAQAGAATTITLDAGASATDDIYRGDRIIIVAGTGVGEHDICISYNGTTKVATVAETWVITPDATSEFILVPASVDIETWQHNVVTGDGDWAAVETHLTDIKGATFSGATDSLEAIRDRGDAAWTTGAGGTPPQLLQSTTIATLASQTNFTLTAGSADDDAYNGAIVIITDSVTSTQKAVGVVSDYVGASKTVTLSVDPGIFTMAVGDSIDVVATLTMDQIADAVWDEDVTGHTTNNTTGKILKGIAEGWVADEGSVNDAGATTTGFISDLTQATDDFFNDATVVFITGALKGQSRIVSDYNGTTKAFTFDEAFTSAPADTTQFIVLAQHTHTLTTVSETTRAEIDANSTQLAAILADTGTDGVKIDATTANQIADALLNRDMSAVSDTNARSPLNALRFLRNKWSVAGTTLTVTKEDDTTAAWTATVSTDAAADPVVGNDPA